MASFVLQALLQVLDGVLTFLGFVKFGDVEIEGNPLVRALMKSIGVAEGLFAVKLFALTVIWLMWIKEDGRRMFKPFLLPINFLYLISSGLWIYILLI